MRQFRIFFEDMWGRKPITDIDGGLFLEEVDFSRAVAEIIMRVKRCVDGNEVRILKVQCEQENGWEYELHTGGLGFSECAQFIEDMRNVFEECPRVLGPIGELP